jgi:hypothetical protein
MLDPHDGGSPEAGAIRSASGAVRVGRVWWIQVGGRVGPTGIGGRVCAGGVKIIFVFGRNALQIAIFWYFIVLPPYPFQKHMTGGSDVRDKAGRIWVSKIFNCIRFLYVKIKTGL